MIGQQKYLQIVVNPTPTSSPKKIEAYPSASIDKSLEQKVENLGKELKSW